MIKNNDKDRILEAVDHDGLDKLISDTGLALSKKGMRYYARCPFHDDKGPSFVVFNSGSAKHPHAGYYCFGCHRGGDAITWMGDFVGLSYVEACRQLAQRYGIDLDEGEMTDEERAAIQHEDNIKSALDEAAKMFENQLAEDIKNGGEVANILKERGGYSDDAIKAYRLGVSGKRREMTAALSPFFSIDTLKAADLVRYDERWHEYQDKFGDRIMFPYLRMGKVIGFTGRKILKPSEKTNYKYVNTGETEVFHKGDNLWGLSQATSSIKGAGKVYIVEGQFDVLACYDRGLKNVVAGSGTAFTEKQRQLIKRMAKDITFMFDGDNAGIHSTLLHIPEMLREGMNVRCVLIPGGKDPDEFCHALGDTDLKIWLANHEMSFVDYMMRPEVIAEGSTDMVVMAEHVNEVLKTIALVNDKVLQRAYVTRLAELSAQNIDMLMQQFRAIRKAQKSEQKEDQSPRLEGLTEAAECIDDDHDAVELVTSWDQFVQQVEERPVVMAVGVPADSELQKIRTLSSTIKVMMPDEEVSAERESNDLLLLKALYRQGYQIVIGTASADEDFLSWYINIYTSILGDKEKEVSDLERDTYIDRCADMIAYAPTAKRVRSMSRWAAGLGITATALKESVKVIVSEHATAAGKNYVPDEAEEEFDFKDDAQTVPDYVTNNPDYAYMLRRFKFYPRLNKKDEPVCYMFRSGESESYHRVCDFFMEPLIHIYDKDPNENKRIVKLYSINRHIDGSPVKPKYVEWTTDTFTGTVQQLKSALKREGPYNLENATSKGMEWETIETWMSLRFKEAFRLKTLGQQKEGFFAWSNAILCPSDNDPKKYEIRFTDNLGLVNFNRQIFYCPAFSEIYTGDRIDDDPYEQDKWLFFEETPQQRRITFEYWARLFDEVYRINDNGKWGILFAIMSAFRSEIYPREGKFTALFFMGQTSSGKSQVATSIRALWMKPSVPISNLNQISEAAFFSILERYRDIPWLFDEYNDKDISNEKFQGLKALVYDGNSKQKRRSATGNDIVSTKVNTSIVLMGQEAPQRDDNALANRVILCDVPSYDFTHDRHATEIFEELKGYERDGLSYLLCEILKIRPVIREHFVNYRKQCNDELASRIVISGGRAGDQTRIVHTVSFFCAICKIIEERCPQLKLPFTYAEFMRLAVEKVTYQVELLSHTDKVSTFFTSMDGMLDRKVLLYGREFRIEKYKDRILKLDGGDKAIPEGTRLLYLCVKNVYDLYKRDKATDDPISRQTLLTYLKANPAYIGTKSGVRFTWQEPDYVARTDSQGNETEGAMLTMKTESKVKWCHVFDYDRLLVMMDIDLVRDRTEEAPFDPTDMPF